MANKELFARHGLVVNTSLLVANTITGNISIGRTDSNYKLDVAGSVNASAVYVNGVPVSGGTGQKFTESNIIPSTPSTGDEWLDSANGILYTYVADSNGSQWVELGPALTVAPTLYYNLDGGTPSTIYGGVSTIDAGGVT